MNNDIPAFPSSNDVHCGDSRTTGHSGMTLRDWFAGQALSSIGAYFKADNVSAIPNSLAEGCYKIADAMLSQRDKNPS